MSDASRKPCPASCVRPVGASARSSLLPTFRGGRLFPCKIASPGGRLHSPRADTVRLCQEDWLQKALYIDMDNTLLDFGARLEGIDPAICGRYRGREDDACVPPAAAGAVALGETRAAMTHRPYRCPTYCRHVHG